MTPIVPLPDLVTDLGRGVFSCPGFFDIQMNGFGGVDFNSPETSLDAMAASLEVIRRTGVRRFFPTVITGPGEAMVVCLANLRRAQTALPQGGMIAGFHVEGPHISDEDGPRGAHLLECIRAPDFAEFESWQAATEGHIRLVTLSPHWPGATDYIERVVNAGATVSIGHTHASGIQITDAVSAGASMSTHLGNAAHRVLPKFPNYLWEQLAEDRLTASFIADGIHLPDEFLRPALRAKSVARSVLVTDASAPAGALPGRYRLGQQDVDLTGDGRVVLAGQDRLAGSALRLNDAIAHVVRVAGIGLEDAIRMATLNPARAVGMPVSAERIVFRFDDGRIEILGDERG